VKRERGKRGRVRGDFIVRGERERSRERSREGGEREREGEGERVGGVEMWCESEEVRRRRERER